jgi:hypothetical protein
VEISGALIWELRKAATRVGRATLLSVWPKIPEPLKSAPAGTSAKVGATVAHPERPNDR